MKKILALTTTLALCLPIAACGQDNTSAQQNEQSLVNDSYDLLIKVLPPPVFTWAFERYLYIQIYEARQHAVNTYSYVISPYSGKIIWSCPSKGFPIPGATQLTNPDQVTSQTSGTDGIGIVAIPQPEQNGLFPPADEAATWVPCVDANGNITPVYEEEAVTAFAMPMENNPSGFGVIPVPGGAEGYSIPLSIPNNIDAPPAKPAAPGN